MAVLKDLIVHGSSRFINAAYFNSLGADKISANEGVFNKLIATNLTAEQASITDLTATNAKVMGLLDVKGELHTNKWTNSNISNIGGSFYISPTVNTTIASGNTPMSITITGTANDRSFQVSGGNFTTDAVKIYENDTTHSVYATGTTAGWPVGSHVMVTGNVRLTSAGVDYPLGTLTGYLTAYLSQGGFTVGGISSSALETIITELGTSNLKSYDISISMFEIGPRGSNTLKPVGIMMTSYGVDNSTYMDIYGGVNTKTTDSVTGFTDPNVRIGYLGGLPAYTDSNNNSHQPVGWGIYTDNGYFKGVVVADSGVVGNFTIAEDLHSGTTGIGLDTNVYVSPGTLSEGISIANSPEDLIWAFAAGSNFGVTTDGTLYAINAEISGKITVGSGSNVYTKTEANEAFDAFGTVDKYITQIDEHGINIHPENLSGDYIETTDTIYNSNKIYYYISDNQYVQFTGSVFNENVTYYEKSLYTTQITGRGFDVKKNGQTIASYGNKIIIGDSRGFHIEIGEVGTNNGIPINELGFYHGEGLDNRVAYINDDQLYITKSVVLQQMDVGKLMTNGQDGMWSWKVHKNVNGKNNLYLKCVG